MKKNTINNIRLGMFIIAGLVILVVSLYMIGQNQSFFGSNFEVKARFRNVNGLMPGNNVRFSGIQCGTVKDIDIINDTTIEVSMLISEKTSAYIRSNALASIGTEGLMGNKVIDILPGTADAPPVSDGGMLRTASETRLDDILNTLSATGDNAMAISSDLKTVAGRINNSPLLLELLTDTALATGIQESLVNFKKASQDIANAADGVNRMIGEVREGKGAAGVLLSDPQAAADISKAIANIQRASERADRLVAGVDSLVDEFQLDAQHGRGAAHLLLKDTSVVKRVQNSLENIEKGTKAFNEDMEALKHNFLLRGYFRKQEKKNR